MFQSKNTAQEFTVIPGTRDYCALCQTHYLSNVSNDTHTKSCIAGTIMHAVVPKDNLATPTSMNPLFAHLCV